MQRWQYRLVFIVFDDDGISKNGTAEAQFNALGADGWEMVCRADYMELSGRDAPSHGYWFKKPVA